MLLMGVVLCIHKAKCPLRNCRLLTRCKQNHYAALIIRLPCKDLPLQRLKCKQQQIPGH